MSLYAQYIQEREGKGIVETDAGFATFKEMTDGLYIEDIYTTPEARHAGVASQLADQIAVIAREKGFSKLYGSIVPTLRGSTDGLKVLLAYGFRLESSANNFILMVKEI